MATYAVGDIQGCYEPLQCLLEQCQFNPSDDSLWVAGDMVNRGPQSLQTLRFLRDLGDSVIAVLGNHDLHLLAVAFGCRNHNVRDTFQDILTAPDLDELVEWTLHRKIIHHDAKLGYTMVHAGIPPQWNLKDALLYGREVEQVLRSTKCKLFFETMYGNEPNQWQQTLEGPERWRAITNYFTRMRFCTERGELEFTHSETADSPPQGYAAWYSHRNRLANNDRIVFGHWASLQGKTNTPNAIALDTGCVWGGQLSILRLEDQKWFRCDCH